MNAALDQVESAVAAGDVSTALRKLRDLRTRVDGCGSQADRTDWVASCSVQSEIRQLIDVAIANLSL